MLLNKKVIYITGGSSGIGQACAKLCLENGAKVIITGRNIKKLEEAKKNLSKISTNLETHQFDIANSDEFQSSLNLVYKSHGKIDGLVNNAPSIHTGMIKDIDFDAWRTNFKANLDAVFISLNTIIPKMMESGSGSIVNIASVVGLRGSSYMAGYGAAKAGLINLTKSAAIEAAPNVRVNCVIPGAVMTDALKKAMPTDEMIDATAKTIPLKRIASPDEVAHPVVFLLSDRSAFITGADLVVDGGKTADLNAGN